MEDLNQPGWIKRQRLATGFIQGNFLNSPSLSRTKMKKRPMGQPEALLGEGFQIEIFNQPGWIKRQRPATGFVCEAPGNGDGCCWVQCLCCKHQVKAKKLLILTGILREKVR